MLKNWGPRQRLLLQAWSFQKTVEDRRHCPAIPTALLASEAQDQGERLRPLVRSSFSLQQVCVLCLVHVPGMR